MFLPEDLQPSVEIDIRFICYFFFLASKEKELGTNTMLLMSLRFTFLAALSVHVAGGVWFFLSCHNVVDMHSEDTNLLHSSHPESCKRDTWGNHEGVYK